MEIASIMASIAIFLLIVTITPLIALIVIWFPVKILTMVRNKIKRRNYFCVIYALMCAGLYLLHPALVVPFLFYYALTLLFDNENVGKENIVTDTEQETSTPPIDSYCEELPVSQFIKPNTVEIDCKCINTENTILKIDFESKTISIKDGNTNIFRTSLFKSLNINDKEDN